MSMLQKIKQETSQIYEMVDITNSRLSLILNKFGDSYMNPLLLLCLIQLLYTEYILRSLGQEGKYDYLN